MEVKNQSIVALLGGNGTGKSTILKACSGIIRAWKGTISFNGEEIQNLAPHKIVEKGLVQVTQGKDVFPAMSVKENLKLGGFVLKIKETKRQKLPAVTHLDGTGRLQTVDKKNNELYYNLIEAFKKISGIPRLLNTSFNENEPIVNTPDEALNCFLRTKMDVLVLEDILITRKLTIDI